MKKNFLPDPDSDLVNTLLMPCLGLKPSTPYTHTCLTRYSQQAHREEEASAHIPSFQPLIITRRNIPVNLRQAILVSAVHALVHLPACLLSLSLVEGWWGGRRGVGGLQPPPRVPPTSSTRRQPSCDLRLGIYRIGPDIRQCFLH